MVEDHDRANVYLFIYVFLSFFYSKHFLRRLSTDIFETFPCDVALVPAMPIFSKTIVPPKIHDGQKANLHHFTRRCPHSMRRHSSIPQQSRKQ